MAKIEPYLLHPSDKPYAEVWVGNPKIDAASRLAGFVVPGIWLDPAKEAKQRIYGITKLFCVGPDPNVAISLEAISLDRETPYTDALHSMHRDREIGALSDEEFLEAQEQLILLEFDGTKFADRYLSHPSDE